ncbi:MAG: hypothetical protein JWP09_470 [Candidatus Taylorbacteria bacterium]|nr:hypothetical protein [Candidatus Taylorbacteria bacterium]
MILNPNQSEGLRDMEGHIELPLEPDWDDLYEKVLLDADLIQMWGDLKNMYAPILMQKTLCDDMGWDEQSKVDFNEYKTKFELKYKEFLSRLDQIG